MKHKAGQLWGVQHGRQCDKGHFDDEDCQITHAANCIARHKHLGDEENCTSNWVKCRKHGWMWTKGE